MKISIIIPVYNISSYIYQCLESVINQTYKNIEIIIVDDGSTDFSGVICSSFAKKDKRIKLIRKQNEGLAEARKTGIKSSTGEYIFNLDGDDWISKECIKDFVDSIEENDTDIVINSFYKEFVGEIQQLPPQFSAKKVNGKRAYKLAREGKEVKLEPATVTIHELVCHNFESGEFPVADLEMKCSTGTYVRSLVRDIAEKCQTKGYTKSLVRLAVGNHHVDKALHYEELSS